MSSYAKHQLDNEMDIFSPETHVCVVGSKLMFGYFPYEDVQAWGGFENLAKNYNKDFNESFFDCYKVNLDEPHGVKCYLIKNLSKFCPCHPGKAL